MKIVCFNASQTRFIRPTNRRGSTSHRLCIRFLFSIRKSLRPGQLKLTMRGLHGSPRPGAVKLEEKSTPRSVTGERYPEESYASVENVRALESRHTFPEC